MLICQRPEKRRRLDTMPESAVMTTMLNIVSTGKTHLAPCHEIAVASIRDNQASDSVRAFASLGAGGRQPSHVERDLHSWLKNVYDNQLES